MTNKLRRTHMARQTSKLPRGHNVGDGRASHHVDGRKCKVNGQIGVMRLLENATCAGDGNYAAMAQCSACGTVQLCEWSYIF